MKKAKIRAMAVILGRAIDRDVLRLDFRLRKRAGQLFKAKFSISSVCEKLIKEGYNLGALK